MEAAQPPLPQLPQDVLRHMLKKLPGPEHVARAMMVSPDWWAAGTSPEVWQQHRVKLTRPWHCLPKYAQNVQVDQGSLVRFVESLGRHQHQSVGNKPSDTGQAAASTATATNNTSTRNASVCNRNASNRSTTGMGWCFGLSTDTSNSREARGTVTAETGVATGTMATMAGSTTIAVAGTGTHIIAPTGATSTATATTNASTTTEAKGTTPTTTATAGTPTLASLPTATATAGTLNPKFKPKPSATATAGAPNLNPTAAGTSTMAATTGTATTTTTATSSTATAGTTCTATTSIPRTNTSSIIHHPPSLRSLELHQQACLSRRDVQGIARLTTLTQLTVHNHANIYALDEDHLTADVASHLATLTRLQVLSLCNQKMEPQGIQHLVCLAHLHSLDIADNTLTEAGAKHIGTLTGLQRLNVNRTMRFGAGFLHLTGLINLQTLLIARNELQASAAQSIATQLPNLQHLDMSGNWLGNAGVEHLAALTNLTTLNISGKHARHGASLSGSTVAVLTRLCKLQYLDISANELMEGAVQALGVMPYLRTLLVSHNQLTAAGVQFIAKLTDLQELDLSFNPQLGTKGFQHLSSLTNLHTLRIIRAGVHGSPDHPPLCLEGLGNSLQVLHVSDNVLGSVVEALTALTTLHTLSMWRTGLHCEDLRPVYSLTKLSHLDLSSNSIGSDGLQHLSALTALHTLDVAGNNIDAHGLQYLSALTNLRTLNTRGNSIGVQGAAHLSSLVNLHTLHLGVIWEEADRYAWLDQPSQVHHLTALSQLRNLTELDLSFHNLGPGAVPYVAALTQLHTLHMYSTDLGKAARWMRSWQLTSKRLLKPARLRPWKSTSDLQALSRLTNLSNLTMSENFLGPEVGPVLAKLTELHTLSLFHNRLGTAGIRHLSTLTNLHTLDISYNNMSSDAVQKLMEQLHGLHVLWVDGSCEHYNSFGKELVGNLRELSRHMLWKLWH